MSRPWRSRDGLESHLSRCLLIAVYKFLILSHLRYVTTADKLNTGFPLAKCPSSGLVRGHVAFLVTCIGVPVEQMRELTCAKVSLLRR